MSLLMLGGAVALGLGALKVALQAAQQWLAPAARRKPPEELGIGYPRCSDDRELRVEYHQSIDRSFSPPKF